MHAHLKGSHLHPRMGGTERETAYSLLSLSNYLYIVNGDFDEINSVKRRLIQNSLHEIGHILSLWGINLPRRISWKGRPSL